MSAPVYAALVHHPVRDRAGGIVTSAITNVDVHDLARSSRTYGLRGYFVVSPIAAQRLLVERILDHWENGAGKRRVPERSRALAITHPVASVDEARDRIVAAESSAPIVIATGARAPDGRTALSWAEGRALALSADRAPILILFGTAHGLHGSLIDASAHVLAPIQPASDFNHLSVRAAAAITFDRLLGDR